MSNYKENTLLLLLAGAAIGVGIGFLFAPDKGTRTRKKIKGGFDDAKKEIKHQYLNATEDLKHKFFSKKDDLQETYDHLVSNFNHNTEDVISFLEEKLFSLKEQNIKYPNNL